ncbi:MAG: hypothetical protein NTX98_00830, partial [Candidatus Doudnabacteria bacterium]|nr:hypothetical protein [Candidatus Doudnabacteria bacterium]
SGQIREEYKFLPNAGGIKNRIENYKSLVVEVDTASKKLDELSYQVLAQKVQIFLKSQGEPFTSSDISFKEEKFPVDLVVILDCQSLEDIGKPFEEQADLFYETPKINISNKAANEYFGAINLVDITATSVAEILVSLFEKYEQQLVDEHIATCLLTGIITKTNSFQHVQTTPQAFLKASQLITLGGRQQEIIKAIYKTKPLPLLRLWGRALARLKILEERSAAYSVLSQSDFEKTQSSPEYLGSALTELAENVSGYNLLALLADLGGGQFKLLIALHVSVDLEKLKKYLQSQVSAVDLGNNQYKLIEVIWQGSALTEIEHRFLEVLKAL